jgi:hypothetical protein
VTDPEHDEAFDAYLKRRSVLPGTPDNQLEPPAAVDRRVLAEAREAVAAHAADGANTDATVSRPGTPRWAVSVALAATLLLCLSVVLNISLNTSRPSPNLQRMTVARADLKASAEANAIAETSSARSDAGAANNSRDRVSGDIPSKEVILPEAKVAGSPAPHVPIEVEPVPGSLLSANPASARRKFPAMAQSLADTATAPARTPAAVAGTTSAPPAGATAPGSKSTTATRHPADPKVWLQQIDALRAAGMAARADAEMRRFNAAFPGYAMEPSPHGSADPPK